MSFLNIFKKKTKKTNRISLNKSEGWAYTKEDNERAKRVFKSNRSKQKPVERHDYYVFQSNAKVSQWSTRDMIYKYFLANQ